MEIVIAKAKNVRGSAQKARIPARIVKGMKVNEALSILKYMPKKAATDVYKAVKSAASNAVNNNGMNMDELYVHNIRVDQAFSLKRYKSGSRGMVNPIKKHFCNIYVEVAGAEKDKTEKKKTEVEAKAKPSKKVNKKTKPAKGATKQSKKDKK